ncbi:hypothetical protein DCCM_2147 [Desulfocucumis palustris]|uniref:Uncharacterized protein n=1 Tax=Desulfocucumis palustris TaxID=1898651 RepID=A0A2L2XAE3_9FIRM|nr:hypothetical protein [Desulfocucumis palustris]GBF33050.1 hypothetical protein DCCM_2147 [Desulfocucumis palustris]
MPEEKEYQLELPEEAVRKLEEYAKKTGQSEDQVVEYILYEFLEKQYRIIEKKAAELNKPVGELMTAQFLKILDLLDGNVIN